MQDINESLPKDKERDDSAVQFDDAEDGVMSRRPDDWNSTGKQAMRDFREQVFILMFLTGFYEKADREPQVQLYFEDAGIPAEMQGDICSRYAAVAAKIGVIDPKISKASQGWNLHRIGKVELNIMRIAVFEMYYDEAMPVSVAINEAVELAKKYGGDQSGAFVNGILSAVLKNNPVDGEQKA